MKKKSSPKLSSLTVTRLRAVAAAILAEPKLYNQWQGKALVRPSGQSCGTPSCLLGWARALFSPRSRSENSMAPGRRVLQLTNEQTYLLYVPGAWPADYREAYEAAKESRDDFTAACVAVARIEHFIRTQGQE